MTCLYRYLYVSSGCQVSWSCFSCKQAYQYLCDRDFFFWDLWLLKLSFRKKWTKHKWRVFKLSWQLVHFTIYSDKCASYSECLWLKFSVWKYYYCLFCITVPILLIFLTNSKLLWLHMLIQPPCLTNFTILIFLPNTNLTCDLASELISAFHTRN